MDIQIKYQPMVFYAVHVVVKYTINLRIYSNDKEISITTIPVLADMNYPKACVFYDSN